MHPARFVFKIICNSCQSIHRRRLNLLFDAVHGLISNRKLSLAGIGRALGSAVAAKHSIKRIDRMLSNTHLQNERSLLYKTTIKWIINNKRRPIVLVDWATTSRLRNFWVLRASTPVSGRSLILYEEVYPEKFLDNPKINKRFLFRLKSLMPANCKPIIVTDAGFRNPWFRAVQELGWDFIGRVRNRTYFRGQADSTWFPCKSIYAKALLIPKYFGAVNLSQDNPISCHFYIYQKRLKYRFKKTIYGTRARGSSSLKIAKREREPWLLATSIGPNDLSAERIVKLYALRMKIECSFKDLKNPRNGFSLSESRSMHAERIEILLLVAHLASIAVWLQGTIGYKQGLQYSYQANTIRIRRVISVFVLGLELCRLSQPRQFDEHQLASTFVSMFTEGLEE